MSGRLESLAEEVARLLMQSNATLSVVETSTGGLISSALLAVPGASKWYTGGVNAYSLVSRQVLLGEQPDYYQNYDGPNEVVVERLAQSIQKSLGTTYALAESGVAGPTLHERYRSDIVVGFNPLAVVGGERTRTKIVKTGLASRTDNMLRFAEEGLEFLSACISSANEI